ncbi:hypothetical protein CDL12_15786 [Handroanthus impetiginosus]|uniref:Pectinesterase inhibitor domain-containing protein n=1 Tax=Handroanthus impetiginosus TaxID=429701 RepID=A0A2G9H284_9LAMI|nr:hypothetical protein CDL12_15786 [Handroanthus impetiginosus]
MVSLILSASLSLTFLYTCQADLIGDVCSKAANPSLCNNILRSDPRSKGANLRGLGQIIIEKAKATDNNAINVANSVKNAGNKDIIDTCIETFGDSISNLNESSRLLNGGDIDALKARASAALTDVSTCDDEFGDDEPPKLAEASRTAQDTISPLLVVANSL